MYLQPKNKFLKTQEAKLLAELTATDWFHNVLTVSLAQMQLNQSPEIPGEMAGAKKFINTLLNLAEIEKEMTQPNKKTLH